jgi:hypothetical protein
MGWRKAGRRLDARCALPHFGAPQRAAACSPEIVQERVRRRFDMGWRGLSLSVPSWFRNESRRGSHLENERERFLEISNQLVIGCD